MRTRFKTGLKILLVCLICLVGVTALVLGIEALGR